MALNWSDRSSQRLWTPQSPVNAVSAPCPPWSAARASRREPSDDEMAEATATSIAEYFDGNVKSLANSRHGARFSVGIIAPGEYKTMLEQMSRMLPNLSCAVRTSGRPGALSDAGRACRPPFWLNLPGRCLQHSAPPCPATLG